MTWMLMMTRNMMMMMINLMQVMTPMNPFFASKFFPASLTLAEEEGLAWCRLSSSPSS